MRVRLAGTFPAMAAAWLAATAAAGDAALMSWIGRAVKRPTSPAKNPKN